MSSSSVMKRVARTAWAAALLCGVVACSTGPRRTDAERQADKEITQRVQTALDSDKELYAKHIFVRSYKGVVELTGFVWDPADLLEAQTDAELVGGVSRVVNSLELQRNGVDDSTVTY
jgi:osmotically-inducible protein OsmY